LRANFCGLAGRYSLSPNHVIPKKHEKMEKYEERKLMTGLCFVADRCEEERKLQTKKL